VYKAKVLQLYIYSYINLGLHDLVAWSSRMIRPSGSHPDSSESLLGEVPGSNPGATHLVFLSLLLLRIGFAWV